MSVIIDSYRTNVESGTVDVEARIIGPYRTVQQVFTVAEATLQALATARSADTWSGVDVVAYVEAALTALAASVSLA
jgi:hypothetical protein